MSRTKIGLVVAAVVALLTAIAFLLADRRLDGAVRRDVEARALRAETLLTQIASLESFDIIARAQGFALDDEVQKGIEDGQVSRDTLARLATVRAGESKPDFIALVDTHGKVVAADSPLPDSDDLKSRFKAVAAAIDGGQHSKDIWDYGKSTVRVGVAPITGASGNRAGAVIVAYAINAREAVEHAAALGADLIFFSGERVVATSFKKQVVDDLAKQPVLAQLARDALAGSRVTPIEVELGGARYLASARALPLNFDNRTTGAIVLASLDEARAPFSALKAIILLLGLGALLVSLITMWVTARALFHQTDDIEAGVTEIINGDADYVFKPVGADFDGLANSLNVMLARLLGRPEPGEEAFEESGVSAKVPLAEDSAVLGARMTQDPDVVALAREPEHDYQRRVFEEFMAARRSVGESVEGITFESFAAKLRLSEANLKKKYACNTVRFRVQTKDNQVSLKPVPIL